MGHKPTFYLRQNSRAAIYIRNKTNKMAFATETIRETAQRVARSLGLDVVDVTFTVHGKQRVLCVFLEKNPAQREACLLQHQQDPAGVPIPGGVADPRHLSWLTHEDCVAFSHDFGTLLDVEDLGPDGEYTLEVSSPGLDRRLTTAEDFERFRGSLVKVQTLEPIANNRFWQGRLTQFDGETLTLDLTATRQNSKSRKTGVQQVEIARRNVERAPLLRELDSHG